jgi:hypothetical protein
MRTPKLIIVALTAIAASVMLGGCFHHQQVYTAEALPPPPLSHPPLK